jgi:hypothetical protein
MNLIEEIKKLKLPSNKYVVVGSGILSVLGIRQANDIDIAVTRDLFEVLLKEKEWRHVEKYGKIFLEKEGVDIIPQLDWDKYRTTTEEAIASADMIDGIPFMNLEELCKFKKVLGREKDIKDLELIENYQKSN